MPPCGRASFCRRLFRRYLFKKPTELGIKRMSRDRIGPLRLSPTLLPRQPLSQLFEGVVDKIRAWYHALFLRMTHQSPERAHISEHRCRRPVAAAFHKEISKAKGEGLRHHFQHFGVRTRRKIFSQRRTALPHLGDSSLRCVVPFKRRHAPVYILKDCHVNYSWRPPPYIFFAAAHIPSFPRNRQHRLIAGKEKNDARAGIFTTKSSAA